MECSLPFPISFKGFGVLPRKAAQAALFWPTGFGAPSHHNGGMDVGSWLGWRGLSWPFSMFFLPDGIIWVYHQKLSWNSLSQTLKALDQKLNVSIANRAFGADVCMSTL